MLIIISIYSNVLRKSTASTNWKTQHWKVSHEADRRSSEGSENPLDARCIALVVVETLGVGRGVSRTTSTLGPIPTVEVVRLKIK